jgi:Ca2+-binding RTX toxin-like protein
MTRTTRLLAGLVAGALTVGAAGSASAATFVTRPANVASVTAAAGMANDISFWESAGVLLVHDGLDFVATGAGCAPVDLHTAKCDPNGLASVAVDAGDRDDVVMNRGPWRASIDGGDGNDRLDARFSSSWNRLSGGIGRDLLLGGPVDDSLDGGADADVMSGGAGRDWADYGSRVAGVRVTIDNVADDGRPGEGDDVRTDVENVQGGSAADVLVGSAADNKFDGGPGSDTLTGGVGADLLYGSSGNDVIHATDWILGNDRIDGGADADDCDSDAGDLRVSC